MYTTQKTSKADLHVHSKHSDRPSEWFLRRIGSPECFVEPLEIYHRARQRRMDFVTISDHNCIRGALEIAHLPGTFISNEVTTYFPEDGCKLHVLVSGITETEFRDIQENRSNVYDLQKYLVEQDIIHSVAHPLFRINSRLTIDHVEKLLVLFKRFEAINGTRDVRAAELVDAIFGHLTPEMIEAMANRHGLAPVGPEPWVKHFTGGSDDHSGAYTAAAHTMTPPCDDVDEFLGHLRRGEHGPAGTSGGSVMMGHCLYHIAYSYYKDRFVRGTGDGKPTIIGELFKKLLQQAEQQRPPASLGQRLKDAAVSFVWARQKNRLSEVDRELVDEFSQLFNVEEQRDVASPPMDDRRTFYTACRISHVLGYSFLRRFEKYARQGRLMESLQTVASLGPVALSMAPYLAAFSTQHKDEPFLQAVAEHFPTAHHLRQKSDRKAWVTDTFADVNGVTRTIHSLAAMAKKTGRKMTVVTCLDELPTTKLDVKNFRPVGTFQLPEYESLRLAFPPFLEVIEYLERQRFSEVIISTPGPMGLTALAAARLLGLRTTGIYHTDFPQFVRYLTGDDDMEELTWKYMLWFYEQTDRILAPSEYYRKTLAYRGFDPTKLQLMVRGVDTAWFTLEKRDPAFYRRWGLDDRLTFVYAGRISCEKNLHLLVDAFRSLIERDVTAQLAIVGDGPYVEELQKQSQGLPVFFTGFLDGEDLATAYASADVMVFPSTTDTFGNAVLEAQASGLPAIVADRGGPPDIVGPHESGLIVNLNEPNALADAMQQLACDETMRNEMGRRALRNAAERRWEVVLEEFWNGAENDPATSERLVYRQPNEHVTAGLVSLDTA